MTTRELDLLPPPSRSRAGWAALIQGPSGVYHFAHEVIGRQLLGGRHCLLLDGANRFNPYAISRIAQSERVRPISLLTRIRISRAFTCHQYLSLLQTVNRLAARGVPSGDRDPCGTPGTWGAGGTDPAIFPANTLLTLFGPLDLFMDEEVTLEEARRCWTACQEELAVLIQKGAAVLLVSHAPERFPGLRRPWWETVKRLADEQWSVEAGGRTFNRFALAQG